MKATSAAAIYKRHHSIPEGNLPNIIVFRTFAVPMEPQKRHIILFAMLTLLLIRTAAQAQESTKNYAIEARVHYGYMYFQND